MGVHAYAKFERCVVTLNRRSSTLTCRCADFGPGISSLCSLFFTQYLSAAKICRHTLLTLLHLEMNNLDLFSSLSAHLDKADHDTESRGADDEPEADSEPPDDEQDDWHARY